MNIAEQKKAARKAALSRRKLAHDPARADTAQVLTDFLTKYRGMRMAGYMPIGTEIDPRPAMETAVTYARMGVPMVEAHDRPLRFLWWTPEMEMRPGAFGAAIPVHHQSMIPSLVIVPLVAFDRRGVRLGYGGGFYDRTLAQLRSNNKRALAVGFAYAVQEVEALPRTPLDEPLDFIITEHEVIRA